MRRLIYSALMLCFITIPLLGQSYRPQVGREHPDFLLPRIDNREPVTLSQFRGKKILLIHFASW